MIQHNLLNDISSHVIVSPSSCFEYDDGWQSAHGFPQADGVTDGQETLRVAHLNVLLPSVQWLLRPDIRYEYQLDSLLPDLKSDVYCFNEASDTYLSHLKSKRWVKEHYYLSHVNATPRKNHEVMISSRKPFRCYRFEGIGDIDHRCLGALFMLNNGKSVLVVAVHLTAYEDKMEKRRAEMEAVCQAISLIPKFENNKEWAQLLSQAIDNQNIIICGDMNLHAPSETRIIYEHKYSDCWIDVHGVPTNERGKETKQTEKTETMDKDSDGITWDPATNSMINVMLLFDNRRMRLDRMLLKQCSQSMKCSRIQLFGNQPVRPVNQHTSLLLKHQCLFPSDHYGLVADFELNRCEVSPWVCDADSLSEEALPCLSQQVVTGYRSIPTIIGMRIGAVVAVVLGVAAVFL